MYICDELGKKVKLQDEAGWGVIRVVLGSLTENEAKAEAEILRMELKI